MRTRIFLRTILLLLSAALFSSTSTWAQNIDYNTDQYAEYQRVIGIEDSTERADAILTFMAEHKGLSLVQYALKNYGELLEAFRTGNHLDNYIAYSEKLIAARPDDTALAQNLILSMAFSSYQLKKYAAAAEYGEKAYAAVPAENLIVLLANSYQQTKDDTNFRKYGELALKELEPSAQTIELATALRVAAANDQARATRYSQAILQMLSEMEKPANASDADWKNYVSSERSFSRMIIARSQYGAERFSQAIKLFEQIVRSTSNRAFRGEAYYYIGMCHWKQGSLDPAMRAFALGSLLKTPAHGKACEKHLEDLYKSTHNGSTAGLDEYIARIKSE